MKLGQVTIGEAVFFGLFKHLIRQHLAGVLVGVGEDLVLFLDQFVHLLDEVVLDLRAARGSRRSWRPCAALHT